MESIGSLWSHQSNLYHPILSKIYFNMSTHLQVKKDEMSGVCSTNGGEEEALMGYWWESQKERDHWEDQDVGGWTISKWILET
jgi:hypothetical protein